MAHMDTAEGSPVAQKQIPQVFRFLLYASCQTMEVFVPSQPAPRPCLSFTPLGIHQLHVLCPFSPRKEQNRGRHLYTKFEHSQKVVGLWEF